jgi:hypothetical protein
VVIINHAKANNMTNQNIANNTQPIGTMMNTWISQNLNEPLEIRTRNLHFGLGIFLAVFFLILGGGGIVNLFKTYGLSDVSLLGCLGIVGIVLLFYFLWTRQKKIIPKTIAREGVFTRDGRKLNWADFIRTEYMLVRTGTFGPIQVWWVELIFTNGKVQFSPARSKNAGEIMDFIYSLPGEHIQQSRKKNI